MKKHILPFAVLAALTLAIMLPGTVSAAGNHDCDELLEDAYDALSTALEDEWMSSPVFIPVNEFTGSKYGPYIGTTAWEIDSNFDDTNVIKYMRRYLDTEYADVELTIANVIGYCDEESSYVSKDTIASVSSSEGKSVDNLAIASIDNREADGTIVLNIPLPQNEFSLGQLLSVELNSSSQKYDCCIPRSALNMEGSGYFVFAVTAEETILGREYTAKKMEVTVLDKNRESVAVEGVSSGQMIIVQSDKILSDGNKVRKMR